MPDQSEPTLEILVLPDRATFASTDGSRANAVLRNANDALAQLGDALKHSTVNFMKSLEEARQ
jgi:hypothetical protein